MPVMEIQEGSIPFFQVVNDAVDFENFDRLHTTLFPSPLIGLGLAVERVVLDTPSFSSYSYSYSLLSLANGQ